MSDKQATSPLHQAEYLECRTSAGRLHVELGRVRVPGGWIYMSHPDATSMVFVPDPKEPSDAG
jgi:hypothetical protein